MATCLAHLGPVATSLPPHRLPQRQLREVAALLLGERAATTSLDLFDNARIEGRSLAMPVEWYLQPHGFQERSRVYADVALRLVADAARDALARAGIHPGDVGGVLAVSTTGIATPSLDTRLANALGLPASVVRLPVWGLGCAGGVAGVARAAELADTLGKPVLLVSVELCTLSFDLQRVLAPKAAADKRALVAAGIFGDGAAAVVVRPGAGRWQVRATHSHLFPHTERVMGWDVEDHNLDVVLSPEIPSIVRREIAGIVQPFLARHGLARPDHWVLHPGGAKVVDAYRDALGLAEADLALTADVLRANGNMSSPTVLFALQAAQARARTGDTALMGALGPGFASELALLEA